VSVVIPDALQFDERGLIPVVVQDRESGDVLMLAFANGEALSRTAETGLAHFWSRSREMLWQKGETSGHVLRARELRTDCDRDALLLVVDPEGPTCHTGTRTCFGDATATLGGVLAELSAVIEQRAQSSPDASYTARLLEKGLDSTLKKLGEEGAEVVIAARAETPERLAEESADYVFHLLVALSQRGISSEQMLEVLNRRRKKK